MRLAGFEVGAHEPLFPIAGPCAVESEAAAFDARSTGNDSLLVCERGAAFGYHNLVVDMRSLAILRATACPTMFDATHPRPDEALSDAPAARPLGRLDELLAGCGHRRGREIPAVLGIRVVNRPINDKQESS